MGLLLHDLRAACDPFRVSGLGFRVSGLVVVQGLGFVGLMIVGL